MSLLFESVFHCKSFFPEPCSRWDSEVPCLSSQQQTIPKAGKQRTPGHLARDAAGFETVSPCFKADSPAVKGDAMKEATGCLSLPCPSWWDLYLKGTFFALKEPSRLSGTAASVKVCTEVTGEWMSVMGNRLLGAAWPPPEDSASREGKWRKRRLSICFRIHRSDESGWRDERRMEIPLG